MENKNKELQPSFSLELTTYWSKNGLRLIKKYLPNLSTNTFPIGVGFSMSVKDTQWEVR